MANMVFMKFLRFAGVADVPASRRVIRVGNGQTISRQALAGDAIGTFTLTLNNVVVGSRVHVEKQSDGTSFNDQVAAVSTVVITLSAYAPGSANNDLRIKVRKASAAPYYKPYETLTTALVGSQSIYVSQIPD